VLIDVFTLPVHDLAQRSLCSETGFFVATDGPPVVRVHAKLHAVHVHRAKCQRQHSADGVAAISLVPVRLLSDGDSQFGVAVFPIDLVQADVADVHSFGRLDGQDHRFLLFDLFQAPFEPALLLGQGKRQPDTEMAAHLRIAEPFYKAR
jgi:hypothetical protein